MIDLEAAMPENGLFDRGALRGDALRGDALRGDALRGDALRNQNHFTLTGGKYGCLGKIQGRRHGFG